MGMAPMAFLLWKKFLKYNPKNAKWVRRPFRRFPLLLGRPVTNTYIPLDCS